MFLRKFWREVYLTLMVIVALVVIVSAALSFPNLTGLGVIAVGVFISVLGVGMYDQWHDAELGKARVRSRR